MAEEINIKAVIDAAGSAKTLGELKQSLRDIKSAALQVGEGSKDFGKLTAAAGAAACL